MDMRLINKVVRVVMMLLVVVFLMGVSGEAVQAVDDTSGGSNPVGVTGGISNLKEQLKNSGLVGAYGTEGTTIQDIIFRIINWLLSLIAVLALLVLVISGLSYVLSFGSDEKTAGAKKMMMYAIIGILIAALSFAIIAAVKQIITGAG